LEKSKDIWRNKLFLNWRRIFPAGMAARCDEGDGRIMLGDNIRWRGGNAAADQVPVCCSSNLNITALYKPTHFTVCIKNSDLGKIILPPYFLERSI
jgi:hypothetical protein